MKLAKQLVFLIFLSLISISSWSQTEYLLSGTVTNDSTKQPIAGATVIIGELQKAVSTDKNGAFSLSLPEGNYTLVIRHVGMYDITREVELSKDVNLQLTTKVQTVVTEIVEITGSKIDGNVGKTDPGTMVLNKAEVKATPSMLGQTDVLATLQLYPGVQSAAQGISGMYVRGGGPDQNLILLDGVPIYNPAHLFGFYSIFNTNMVEKITLIKGGMPANYGGRLSSVMDIVTNDGNDSTIHASGGAGLISADLTVDGPLFKKKANFSISGRRTYIDLLGKPIILLVHEDKEWGYYFQDFNGKLVFNLSKKDKLSYSGYTGQDKFKILNKEAGFGIGISWGNSTSSLTWRHLFSDKLVLSTQVYYSGYRSKIDITQGSYKMRLYSGIYDWCGKSDLKFYPSEKHAIKIGGSYTFHTFSPTNIATNTALQISVDLDQKIKQYSHDVAFYASEEYTMNNRLRIRVGLRYSYFQHVGPFDKYLKNEFGAITDTLHYGRGEHVADYNNLEPRLSTRILLNNNSSIKVAFVQNYQYIHMVSYATVSMPSDIWIPSSAKVKPQFSTQYSIGYFKDSKKKVYEASVEVYYKTMANQIEFKNGYSPEDDILDNPEDNFVFGDGQSYGIELFIKKRMGKTTGWIGYALSSTSRKFPDINAGAEYYAKYDRRHDLSLVAMHEINENWSLSGVFVYATGNATTMPQSRYAIDGNIINEYGDRNNYRLADYHRLDLSLSHNPKKNKNRNYQTYWSFGIYNLYNRNNPYFIYFDDSNYFNEGIFDTKAKQVSLFPIMPSVRWEFLF
ncbi:MAG TPA: TonB-dependent receptor [Flavobacteriales bacterium]|nr:TonB-dependent receptor [Flavobacteriales bacterium]HIO49902.1 TonB-dependent receptor [Candidatus Poribacteria bacterium]